MGSAIGSSVGSAAIALSGIIPALDVLLQRTSFLQTGFSSKTTCVSFAKPDNGSRSASSCIRLLVRTRVLRPGMLLDKVGWIVFMRLRATRSVRSRGERGKLERVGMSLSVRSKASWSYICRDCEHEIYLFMGAK